jgi:iron complex outermembrane recepter protein
MNGEQTPPKALISPAGDVHIQVLADGRISFDPVHPKETLRHTTSSPALVVLAALLVVSPSWAAPLSGQVPDSVRPPASPDSIVLGEVRVLIPRPTLAQTGGAGSIRLELDSMSVIAAPRLEDVLRRVPLIQIRSNSRGEAQPALRGADSRQIAVLVDGVPITLGWDHRTDLSVIPLTAARSVNLLRGASSVLYGPNVLGGVVEIDVVRGAKRMSAPVPMSISLGVDDTGATSAMASLGRLAESDSGQWLVNAGFGFRDRPGFALPGLTPSSSEEALRLADPQDQGRRLNSDYTQFDAFVASRFLSKGGAWTSISASGFQAERGVPPEFHEEKPRLWRYPSQDRVIAAISGGSGLRSTRWGEGDLEASIGIDVGGFEIESFESLAFEEVVAVERGDDRTLTLRLLGDHTLGPNADLRTALTFGDVSHTETLQPGGVNDYRQRLWSLALETQWRLGRLLGADALDGTRLSLGVVVDGADTPETGNKPALGRMGDWGMHLGVSSIHAGGNVVFHSALSRRVRFPSLRELYSGALGRFVPNSTLRPEVQWSAELGATWNTKRFDLQVVGFRQKLRDGIVRVLVEGGGGRQFRRTNSDRVESTGLEVIASGDAGPVRFTGDFTLQRTWLFNGDGVRSTPEYEPRVSSRLDVSLPLLAEIRAAVGMRYQSEQFCVSGSQKGVDRLSPNDSFDAELRRSFRLDGRRRLQNLEVIMGISNLGDSAIFDQCGLPQAGRTLRAQIRLF